MTTDLSLPCIRDGRPAVPHGEHHRETVGMGGAPSRQQCPTDPTCRGCHSAFHRGEWEYEVDKAGWVHGHERHGGEFHRPLVLNDDDPDRRYWTNDRLADNWHEADKEAVACYKVQCQVAWALKERYEWQPEWWLHAAKVLTIRADRPVDWQRVYDRVKSWETFELRLGGGAVWDDVYLLGEKARQAVAGHDDPQWALDKAVVARLGGATIAQVVRLLKGDTVSDEVEKVPCICPTCGHQHYAKGE